MNTLPVPAGRSSGGARAVAVTAIATAVAALMLSCGDSGTEPAPQPPTPVATSLTVTPASAEFAALGETVQFAAEVRDQNGQAMAGATVSWASGDASVATVDATGLVTAAGNGTATITATSGSASGSATVAVAQAVAAVAVSPPADTLVAFGDTVRLTAEASDANGHPVADAEFDWATSDASVATVDTGGLVTATSNGAATVTARSGEAAGTAEITVEQAVAEVEVSPTVATLVSLGDTVRLVAVALDAHGHPVSDTEFEWSSSDASVATVDAGGLVTATGNGAATVTASSGQASSAVQITIEQAVSAVTLETDSVTIMVGDTLRLSATPTDANGHTVTGAAIKWTSSAPSVASVNTTGLMRGASRGRTVVAASSDEASDSATVTVHDPSLVTVTRVEPTVLIEGRVATVHGWGFSPLARENEVFVGGLPAPVLSSTATRLSITVPRADCLPPREVLLRVSTTAGRDSVAIGSTPLSEEDRDWPQFEWRHTSSGDGCMHLPGNAQGGEFLIGVTSISEDPSHLAPVTLAGRPGDASILAAHKGSAVPHAGRVAYSRYPAPLISASSRVRPPPFISGGGPQQVPARVKQSGAGWFVGHVEAMARNQALVEKLGRPDWSARSSAEASARSSLAEGDIVTLNTICCDNPRVRAVVRLVTDNFVWLDDDLANPDGPFTDAELTEMDDFYSDHAKPVHENYFGSLSDVDGNGRILVLMTNENESAGVNPCDLYPKDQCRWSNEAEIFYHGFPDSDRRDGMLSFLPTYLTHEATHLIQYTAWVFGDAPRRKGEWELEGGAILSEHCVGHRLFGQSSGQNLGYPEYSAGRDWYRWHGGLFDFFSGGRGAPEECTWLTYKGWGGNDGPCELSLNYWVGALVLQFAMDRWGGRYPGGERAMLKRMTQSPLIGFANLVDVSPGWSIERILGEFYATLWLEGTAGRDTPGMTSWDIHDIVSRFDDSLWLKPYSSSSATPSVSARIRAGSSMYFHWSPHGPLRPTSFKVEPADEGPVFVWAIRAR